VTAHIATGQPGYSQGIIINYTTAPIEILDLGCYATAFELTPSTEDIDVGVMCAAGLTDQGRTTYSAVLVMLWEPRLYTDLQPHINHVGKFSYMTDYPDGSKVIQFNTRFAAQPWGRFEIGQRVEVELPLAVLETPYWIDLP